MDRIGVIGASYRTATTDAVAAAQLPADFDRADLLELARLAGFAEMVYLATCNRVELHFRTAARDSDASILFHLRRSLIDLTDGQVQLPPDDELYVYRGEDAVRHLFRVTAALDSMMVGEAQIAGQVKAAHEEARSLELLGGILDQVFQESFRLAKRIRTETELARRPVSLVTLVERALSEQLGTATAPVLIAGAGEMAEQALRLVRAGDPLRPVLIANRTLANAEALVADDPNARAVALRHVLDAPLPACVLLTATSSEEIVFPAAVVEGMRRALPQDQTLLAIDLALPANIDPACAEIDGVELLGIEQMRAEAEHNRRLRMAELDRCEAMVDHQIVILRRHLLDRSLSPVARHLNRSFREVSERALARALAKELGDLGENEQKAVTRMAEHMVKQMVQIPLRGLKGAAWDHSIHVLESFLEALEGDNEREGRND